MPCNINGFRKTKFLILIERAKESVIHISSGPVILMYNLSYVTSLLIAAVQLSRYPVILALYLLSGLLGGFFSLYSSQQQETLTKKRQIDINASAWVFCA